MDDLLDLDFSSPPATSSSKPPPNPFQPPSSVQNSLRSNSPSLFNATSQRPPANYAAFSNPSASTPTVSNVPSRSGTPNAFNSNLAGNLPRSSTPQQSTTGGNKEDSFARLFGKNGVSGAAGDLSKLSLGERQRILNEEKAKISGSASTITEDDLLSAFSADAPVNAATRFPPPKSNSMSSTRQERMSSASQVRSTARDLQTSMKTPAFTAEVPADDDDPFGLGMGPSKPSVRTDRTVSAKAANGIQHEDDEDEDVLGLLGRPIAEVRARSIPRTESPRRRRSVEEEPSDAVLGVTPRDRMVAEIVEMGFPLQKASEALDAVGEESGVQGAISYLLNAAHAEARKETYPELRRRSPSREHGSRRAQADARVKDPSQRAQEIGKSFLSTANSLWKTGAKNLKKAVADFQESQSQTSSSHPDSDVPKWMRNTGHESNGRAHAQVEREDRTDEAMMLEAREEPVRPARRTEQTRPDPEDLFSRSSRRKQEMLFDQDESIRRDTSRSSASQAAAPSQSRTREIQEASRNEGSSAYISPARRKKPAAVPDPKPSQPEEDIFAPAPAKVSSSKPQASTSSVKPQPRSKPTTTSRPIPTVSQHALKTSHKHRFAGTASFKLGNYSAAIESYSSSLTSLPSTHPLYIVILTNRALTHLKTGDPKASIIDADAAISQIGPSKGLNETVDLEDETGTITKKDMYEYWGKAMMRRAEALEQLEKWDEAAQVWKQCVEGNVGGAVSAKGRERCERAIASHRNPAPSTNGNAVRPTQTQRPAQQTQTKKSTVPRTSAATQAASNAKSREAVTKLRAANDAANAAEDEKFALSDAVSGRIEAWRKGKEGNLRALLASLDNVLWEGSGWKKVGMGELIMPNKVKVVYMKGIGKCHPDKLSQGATTEQVMIAGSVFSTLNEAWDKFKAENGL